MTLEKIKKTLVMLLIISMVLIIGFTAFRFNSRAEDEIISREIEEKIVKIVELSTIKYNYTDMLSYKNTKQLKNLNLPFTEKKFIIQYSGYLKAGIDMSNLKIEVKDKDTIHVEIPKPKIIENVIIEEEVKFFDEKSGLFNKLNFTDLYDVLIKEKEKAKEKAIKNGILKEAEENTKEIILYLLKEMGYENIEIEFE